jgi:hypothetical protein
MFKKPPTKITGADFMPRPPAQAAVSKPTPSKPIASVQAKPDREVTVSTRKIDNGYVTRTESWGQDGYDSKETFSEQAPEITAK